MLYEVITDSLCVAKVLLNELDNLPDANIKDDTYYIINQLVTRRYKLTKTVIALKNQLHAQLAYHYRNYNTFFCKIDGTASLAFWHKYPSPVTLKNTTVEELAQLLSDNSNKSLSTVRASYILDSIKTSNINIANPMRERNNFV